MSERWFEELHMGMRVRTNEAILMRLSDGVMVRTRSIQRQEREVTKEMLYKLVGVPWDPTRVVRARADRGHHDGEHVIPGQISNADGLPINREQTPRSMYITSDLIWQYGPTPGCPKCRSVARGDSINQTLPHSRACREGIERLVGNDPLSRDRLSRAEERKTRCLAEHIEKKFGSRPDGVTPTTPGDDSANAQDMQDNTSGSSRSRCHHGAMRQVLMSVPLSKRNVPGQMTSKMILVKFLSQKRTPIKSWRVKRVQAQKNLMKWTLTTQEGSVLVVAHVWLLLSRWS